MDFLDFGFDDIATVELESVGTRAQVPHVSLLAAPSTGPSATLWLRWLELPRTAMEQVRPPPIRAFREHASIEYVFLPLADDLCHGLRTLHEANNLPVDSNALREPTQLFCYLCGWLTPAREG